MSDKSKGHSEHIMQADNFGVLEKITRPLKIVFLGAGSCFFGRMFPDVIQIPNNCSGEMYIVDIDEHRLELAERVGNKILEITNCDWKLQATTDRRKFLKDADYIVNCIEVSGSECVRWDNDIPAKYGIDQCIGDTIGPGGLMKALRTAPVFLEVLKDVKELAPNAWVLNYTNPMSILCQCANLAGFDKVLGLCHSVQHTSHALAEYAGVDYDKMHWRCGGINHNAWFTTLSHEGQDLYPFLQKEASKKSELYEKDPIRFDMMQHFGAFVTESSGHFSEYLPYYRKRPELLKKYIRSEHLGESAFYANNWPTWRQESDRDRLKQIETGEIEIDRSWEYASWIIEAIEMNKPFIAHCTVPNRGLIPNLQQSNVCEVACTCNRDGVTPMLFGELPPQLAGLCESNLRMVELAAAACVNKDPQAAIHSLMLDSLTAAVCCPEEIENLTMELFRAQADYIPQEFVKFAS